jgi:hypothetical protein
LLWLVALDSKADLSQDQANSIWMQAYAAYGHDVGGFPLPEAPTIHVISRHGLREALMERGDAGHGTPLGLYWDGVVYVLDELDFSSTRGAGVLFHEFIHYAQSKHLGPLIPCRDQTCRATACAQWLSREMQALKLHYEALRKAHAEQEELEEVRNTARAYKQVCKSEGA